jgi:hypothetical protein
VLSTFGGETGNDLVVELLLVVGRAAGLVVGLAAIMKWVLPWVLHRLARSQELLIVSAVAWAVSMAAFGDWLGFSIEVGAFLAGFALASTPFRESIGSSLTPLRDFLLLFFFIELGARLDFGAMGTQIPAAILLSIFVLVGNPLIVLVIMGLMGYRRRVGFLAGLTVAQISEFSLIFVTLGFDLGHVGDETVGLVTLVGLVTIGLSTYMILYSHVLFERLEPFLGVFERKRPTKGDEDLRTDDTVDAVVFGVGRFGAALTEQLLEEDLRVLVVDWDPQRIQDEPEHPRLELVFGDAEDGEFPATLPLQRVRSVVCTIPAPATSAVLVSSLRRNGYDGPIAVTAHTRADAEWLRSVDADLVLQPFEDAAGSGSDSVIALLTDGSSGDGTGSDGRREPEQSIDTGAESGERT